MFHIIYASRAVKAFSRAEFKDLLQGSRTKNARTKVTGMLVYHESVFVQVLEGEEQCVRGIFQSIEKDPRHTSISVLRRNRPVCSNRIFGDWSMGFLDGKADAKGLRRFIRTVTNQHLLTLREIEALDLSALLLHQTIDCEVA